MPATFDDFFRTATNGQTPYEYQRRLAGASQISNSASEMRESQFPCTSRLISIPTVLDQIVSRN